MARHPERRAEPLTLDHLAALDAPCRTCARWELDPVRRARAAAGGADAVAAEKRAWVSAVLRDWGSCGRVLLDADGVPVAHVVYAPAALVPGAATFPTSPTSPDAVLMAALRVHPAHRGGGLGRLLVQAMAADLVRRGGIRAVEAFGVARGAGGPADDASCVVPTEFLGRVGFGTVRPHPRHPRLRMELRSALTWRDEVEAALERLRGVVRPETAPSPAPRAHREVPGTGGGA